MNTQFIFLIFSLSMVSSLTYHDIQINSDDDCWPNANSSSLKKYYEVRVKFSTKVATGTSNCIIHITNPWLTNIQNGFGLFITQQMDCASMLTVDCLTENALPNETKSLPVQFTCHTSKNKIQMPCSTISLMLQRNAKMPEGNKETQVQVVALATKPCIDDELFFQCPNDFSNACIDKKLKCNGRSECPSGDDEHNCHASSVSGISPIVFFLISIAALILICVLSTVFVCCCCRAVFNGIIRWFRSQTTNKSTQRDDMATNGEDSILMKGLTAPTTDAEISSQKQTEPTILIIDSTKPIYPRLE